MTSGLCKVEVTFAVPVEIEGELVEMVRDVELVVEVLVVVRLTVLIEIVQNRDLIPIQDVDLAIHNFQALRHVEAHRIAAPSKLVQVVIDTVDNPNVAGPCRYGRSIIIEECEVSRPEPRIPRIFEGKRDFVHSPRAAAISQAPLRFNRPAVGARAAPRVGL